MANPVLVEVTRGDVIESRHRGSVAVIDGDGAVVMALGEVGAPVFPRSAVKAIQALPLVESGAADRFAFDAADLALACASHVGEEAHAERAAAILKRAGLSVSNLECGAHWPTRQEAALELAAEGRLPTALHNNCSGKHSGFLCTCVQEGDDPAGYVSAGHVEQVRVRAALEEVTGAALGADVCGTDGCSIPTYAIPLKNIAHGFARMATGTGLAPLRAKAARRLIDACMVQPFFVAGTEQADTLMMTAGQGKVFCKYGAEAVYCAALPELGLGIAIKCDDGAKRGVEVMVAAVVAQLLRDTSSEISRRFDAFARPAMSNWNGIRVGGLRPAGALG